MCASCRFLVNNLKLNRGKTELLILNASHRPRPPVEAIQVSSERITPVSSARNIGVVFDQEMTLAQHGTTICKTCFLHLRNIAKIRDSLSQKDTEILVHEFISSKLDSCNSLLYGLPQSLIDRLQAVQNCAARLVTRSRKHDHITPILKQLHWLPVYSRIKYKMLLLIFKALHGLAPSYITEMLQPYKPSGSLRSSSKRLLTVPSAKLKKYGCRSFSFATPTIWNSLPEQIRIHDDISNLKLL